MPPSNNEDVFEIPVKVHIGRYFQLYVPINSNKIIDLYLIDTQHLLLNFIGVFYYLD